MLSAGLLGGPGIGFEQDHFASEELRRTSPELFEEYKAPSKNEFLWFETVGLDGSKTGLLEKYKVTTPEGGGEPVVSDEGGEEAARTLKILRDEKASGESIANQQALVDWWAAARPTAKDDKPKVEGARLHGSRMALRLTAFVPATMALIYLGLILYFKAARGGYKPQILVTKHEEAEMMTSGVSGPAEF
jgi:hypothetical protein